MTKTFQWCSVASLASILLAQSANAELRIRCRVLHYGKNADGSQIEKAAPAIDPRSQDVLSIDLEEIERRFNEAVNRGEAPEHETRMIGGTDAHTTYNFKIVSGVQKERDGVTPKRDGVNERAIVSHMLVMYLKGVESKISARLQDVYFTNRPAKPIPSSFPVLLIPASGTSQALGPTAKLQEFGLSCRVEE